MHRGHTETGRKEFLKKAHFLPYIRTPSGLLPSLVTECLQGCLMGKWCSPLHCRYLKQYVKLKAYWTGFLHEPTFIRNLHCQFFYIFFHLTVWIRARKLKLYSSKVKALKKRAGVSTIFEAVKVRQQFGSRAKKSWIIIQKGLLTNRTNKVF